MDCAIGFFPDRGGGHWAVGIHLSELERFRQPYGPCGNDDGSHGGQKTDGNHDELGVRARRHSGPCVGESDPECGQEFTVACEEGGCVAHAVRYTPPEELDGLTLAATRVVFTPDTAIRFIDGTSSLTDESMETLTRLADYFYVHGGPKLRIQVFTSQGNSADDNIRLSSERASEAAQFLDTDSRDALGCGSDMAPPTDGIGTERVDIVFSDAEPTLCSARPPAGQSGT